MWPEFLVFAQCCVFVLGFIRLFRSDRLAGLYFAALFVYGIFAQIGYFFRPDLSQDIKAYFGEEVGVTAAWCVLLSLAGFAILAKHIEWIGARLFPFSIEVSRSASARWRPWGYGVLALVVVFQACYLVMHRSELGWLSVQELTDVADNPSMGLFVALHKLMVGWLVVVYAMLRSNDVAGQMRVLICIGGCMLAVFSVTGAILGNRTDFVALFLGVACYEAYRTRFSVRVVGIWSLVLVVVYIGLTVLEYARYDVPPEATDRVAAWLGKDYYAPAHMLFAVVSLDFVRPTEVVASNVANMLVRVGHPYLQETITELFNPGVATRSAGYAFYVFAEGYAFMGMWGWIYNAVVLTLMLAFWRRLSASRDDMFNLTLKAIMACMLINLSRGQSSYFVKYLYSFCLPSLIVYIALGARRVRVRLAVSVA